MQYLKVVRGNTANDYGLAVGLTIHGLPVIKAQSLINLLNEQFKGKQSVELARVWHHIPTELQLVDHKDNELVTMFNMTAFLRTYRFLSGVSLSAPDEKRKALIMYWTDIGLLLVSLLVIASPVVHINKDGDWYSCVDLNHANSEYGLDTSDYYELADKWLVPSDCLLVEKKEYTQSWDFETLEGIIETAKALKNKEAFKAYSRLLKLETL